MMRISLFAAGIAAFALGSTAAAAQAIAPGYHMEREYFHAGPATPPGSEALRAPGQNVPSFEGQTHVPSQSAQGRGGEQVEIPLTTR